jgi:hypothetical protein
VGRSCVKISSSALRLLFVVPLVPNASSHVVSLLVGNGGVVIALAD